MTSESVTDAVPRLPEYEPPCVLCGLSLAERRQEIDGCPLPSPEDHCPFFKQSAQNAGCATGCGCGLTRTAALLRAAGAAQRKESTP